MCVKWNECVYMHLSNPITQNLRTHAVDEPSDCIVIEDAVS